MGQVSRKSDAYKFVNFFVLALSILVILICVAYTIVECIIEFLKSRASLS